jgi:F0F1-type ATP synthase assembly protein I
VPEPEDRSSFAEAMQKAAPLLNLGLTFAVTVGLGVAAGWGLDRWLGTSPWLLLAGIFLGLVAAFVGFFSAVMPPKGGGNEP